MRLPAASVVGCRATNSRRRNPQDVAHAADRMDQPRLAAVALAPQVADARLNDVPITAEAVIPDVVEDLRFAENASGVDHQVAQELELGRRQGDDHTAPPHFVAVLVEL